jgi:uncharacterized protein YdiU (UPF0061 family)
MNTDNFSISGETIDYGPCAFMEAYHPATVFSSIDRHGRYAYGNQPQIALWNLTRFTECLIPLLEQEAGSEAAALDSATMALSAFAPQYEAAFLAGLRCKLGLFVEHDQDRAIAQDLLRRMALNGADFTLTFRRLCDAAETSDADAQVRVLFNDPGAFDAWAALWRPRLEEENALPRERSASMRTVNPIFIPRNHRVEGVITAAVERQDFRPFQELLEVVSRPYDERPEFDEYTWPARPEERVLQTFCGT